ALDDLTLKVELRSPTPYFLELTVNTIFSPIHRLIDQLHPNWPLEEGNGYICNGAFQLIKNKPTEGYKLTKNPLYWDADHIWLEQAIILKMNRYQAYEMFQKGENHWTGAPLLTWDPNFFIPSESDEIVDFLYKSIYWYTFNSSKPPFNHKKFRQAFSIAIDRQQVASDFNTKPIFSPLPIEHSLIRTCSSYNPEMARELFQQALEETGLSRESFPVLNLIHLAGNSRSKIAEKVRQFWESTFGIQCIIEPLEWKDLFKKITEGDYFVGGINWQAWANDPLYTLSAFREALDPMNFPKWENNKFQEILHLAEKEIDLPTRQKYYRQAEEILLEEMPIAPLIVYPSQALKKKDLILHSPSYLLDLKWAYFKPWR
ncbi:MAG TPA: peptide ABC transporter substrate-binding protein, partial [Candidatus Babeliaceae bacterium]|nr:peptide ABC transporter substrate-binding protein [Candidatus Babeliaceae bacterium]